MTNLLIRANGTTEIGAGLILSCDYIEQVNTSDDVAFGCAAASCISVEVRGALTSAVSAGEELTYYQVDDSDNRTLIGKFYVGKPTIASKNSYKFEAYDAVSKLDKDLSEWLYGLNTAKSFPYTLKDFATMVCTQCGLTFSTSSFLNDSYSVKAFYSDNITGRDLMGLVAELAGGYVKATTAGAIVISWYTANSAVQIAPTASGAASGVTRIPYFLGGLSYENYTTAQVQRVQIHGDEADIGVIYPTTATGVTYEVSNNILLTNATQEELLGVAENLFNRISTFQYRPCSIKVPRSSLLHAGEIINVVDANGVTFDTIIMEMSFSQSGVTVESTGNESRDSTAGVASRKYKNIFGKMLTVEMSVEGLKLEATALDGRMTTVEATVDGLASTVTALEETAIATVEVQYALSASSTEAPTTGWSTTAPAWESGKYMWQRTKTTYSDSTAEVPHYTISDPTCIQGAKGEDGSPGAKGEDGAKGDDGVGISSIITQYYLSTSSTTQTGGSWGTTAPAWSSGHYIWTRSYITWDDGTTSYTTPQLDNTSNDLGSKYSSVKQTADKIEWLVASGTTESDFTITDRLISLISTGINITGYVTFNDLSTSGKTTINGSNITTGRINADLITTGTLVGIEVISRMRWRVQTPYAYYKNVALNDGSIEWYVEKYNPTTEVVAATYQLGSISAEFDSGWDMDFLLISSESGYAIRMVSGGNMQIEVEAGGYLEIGNHNEYACTVTVGNNNANVLIRGGTTFNCYVNGGWGSAGQVLKSDGKRGLGTMYWENPVGCTLLWSGSLSSGSAYYSGSSYSFLIIIGSPGSSTSYMSVVVPIDAAGNKYQIADESYYLSFYVYTGYLKISAANGNGAIKYVYGVK